ncbi:TPA: glycerol dehydrogenase, partial [Candidatus Sumerlaeota bacterium]|nr:glycerol dehydrogenase [Candidatus Sumerlaeota bacterium]
MNKIMISPSRYVQGSGALADIGKHMALLGENALVIGGTRGLQSAEKVLTQSCQENNVAFSLEHFNGECCRVEIDRLVLLAQNKQADLIV